MHQQVDISPVSFSVKNTQTDNHKQIGLDDITGQASAKRALIIAIAGHHNILLFGPPGTGKTLLAKASPSLLPPPSLAECIAITKIHSLNTHFTEIATTRPYRAPHHSASLASLIGGGPTLTPGEISLAHHGILHLDELPEFPRDRLEALRQPLEDRVIRLHRLGRQVTYPADFILIATANPCPCGYLGSPTHACSCTSTALYSYRRKFSGPLLDRLDIIFEMSHQSHSLLRSATTTGSEQDQANTLIKTALANQLARYGNDVLRNGTLSSHQVVTYCQLTTAARHSLDSASEHYQLSARAYFKIIKVAQTIADLESSPHISSAHIAEAIQYRPHITTT